MGGTLAAHVGSYRAAAAAPLLPPALACCLQAELCEKLTKMYDVKDPNCVFVFGMRTQFGGGKSSGFGLIYDNVDAAKKFEPKYRLVRVRACLPACLLGRLLKPLACLQGDRTRAGRSMEGQQAERQWGGTRGGQPELGLLQHSWGEAACGCCWEAAAHGQGGVQAALFCRRQA